MTPEEVAAYRARGEAGEDDESLHGVVVLLCDDIERLSNVIVDLVEMCNKNEDIIEKLREEKIRLADDNVRLCAERNAVLDGLVGRVTKES